MAYAGGGKGEGKVHGLGFEKEKMWGAGGAISAGTAYQATND
jgi:hypothetical protein